jgi:hypothetical protein
MSADSALYNIEVFQGASWEKRLLWKDSDGNPIDLASYGARMEVRSAFDSPDILLLLETDPKPGGGAGNGRITLGLVSNPPDPDYNILLEVDAATTAALPAKPGWTSWVYDLEIVSSGGLVRRLLMGRFTVSLEVTK